MKILVTGGCGYIGSHTVRYLHARGHAVVVLDDLSNGHAEAIPDVPVLRLDLVCDPLVPALTAAGCEVAIHFAGKTLVPESVREPATYYRTNVVGGLNLLDAIAEVGMRGVVFSSTCAVYGIPASVPLREDAQKRPTTAYGASKLAFEFALEHYTAAYGLGAIALRYFNAAGACASGAHGEDHAIETHVIPLLLRAAQSGEPFKIFGTDYPTPDGSCVRDYIHIDDLACAHALAVEALEPGRFDAVNLGTGAGTSVRQLVEVARKVTGIDVQTVEAGRRPGDPPTLVAAPEAARRRLDFHASAPLEDMVRSAWRWHSANPNGYGGRR